MEIINHQGLSLCCIGDSCPQVGIHALKCPKAEKKNKQTNQTKTKQANKNQTKQYLDPKNCNMSYVYYLYSVNYPYITCRYDQIITFSKEDEHYLFIVQAI